MSILSKQVKANKYTRFLMNDKDPYICYHFTIALEKLMPLKYTQIKPIMVKDGSTDWGEKIKIELTPADIHERYLLPLYEDPEMMVMVTYQKMEAIRKLVGLYCRYVKSTQEDRAYWMNTDSEIWQEVQKYT